MKRTALNLMILAMLFAIYSCGGAKKDTDEDQQDTTAMETDMPETSQITLTPVTGSPDFPNAMLRMNTPQDGETMEAGPVAFNFDVTNYELTAQTADTAIQQCANSAKGQHIHLILNNSPYTAHYEAQFEQDMEPGHYVALAFLSRSYHESVKNPDAYVVRQFTVGDADGEPADLNQPHMFYSRPKGTYSGADTENLLLDFYILNADLSPDGYNVRATINGEEFMIDEWQPQFINGLPLGQVNIKLEFLDADGNLVNSPFNPVERTVTLEAGDQPV